MGQRAVDMVANEGGDEEAWQDDGEDDEYAAEGQVICIHLPQLPTD